MDKKLRVLFWADSPICATGFATVSRNILRYLNETGKYEFTVIGINHDGSPYDTRKYPYAIHPAIAPLADDPKYKNPYGYQKFIDFAMRGNFDLVFVLNDTFLISKVMPGLVDARNGLPKERKFPIIYYFPIDGVPRREWIELSVYKVDFPVTYTEFAKRECEKITGPCGKLDIIRHGVDKEVFHPVEDLSGFKERFFGKHKDKFIVLNVNRNQPRKDLHRTLSSFSIFHDKYPETFLFMLCQLDDVGGNLIEIGENYGLRWNEDWSGPPIGAYGASQGYPVETLNMVYSSVQLVVSTTTGEGWGLSSVEAMACKTPVLFPRNTSLVEIIGENEERGYLCKSGADLDHLACFGKFDNNVLRSLTDVNDMASKMEYVYSHRAEAEEKAERAYREVVEWKDVAKEWIGVFEKAEVWMNHLRSDAVPERNSPCPCGSGKKYKHCHG